MTETTKKSTQLAEYLTSGPVEIGSKKTPGIEITYHWLNSSEPAKVRTVRYFKGALSEESVKVLCSLRPHSKDKFVMVKEEKPNPAKPGTTVWNVIECRDATTWEDKPMSSKKSNGDGYNGDGAQVGNSLTNAVNSLERGSTAAQVKERAKELIMVGEELKSFLTTLRAQTTPTAATAEAAAEANHVGAYQRADDAGTTATMTSADSVPF